METHIGKRSGKVLIQDYLVRDDQSLYNSFDGPAPGQALTWSTSGIRSPAIVPHSQDPEYLQKLEPVVKQLEEDCPDVGGGAIGAMGVPSRASVACAFAPFPA